MSNSPDGHGRHTGWRAEDEPGGRSGPGSEPLVYERYLLDWEWRNYLGCLWLPGLLLIISVSQWWSALGVPQVVVQVTALAAVLALFFAFALIDLSRDRWDWRGALIRLWLPGWIVLLIIATAIHLTGQLTIAATGALALAFLLYTRSQRHRPS